MDRRILRKIFVASIVVIMIVAIFSPIGVLAGAPVGAQTDTGLVPCGSEDNPCDFRDFIVLIARITSFLLVLGISVAAIAFAWAGFLYVTAAGSSEKINEAHSIFGKVVVGFLLMLSAWLIVKFVQDTLVVNPDLQNIEEFTGE